MTYEIIVNIMTMDNSCNCSRCSCNHQKNDHTKRKHEKIDTVQVFCKKCNDICLAHSVEWIK